MWIRKVRLWAVGSSHPCCLLPAAPELVQGSCKFAGRAFDGVFGGALHVLHSVVWGIAAETLVHASPAAAAGTL